jgi:UV DNA damage endonuclease
MRRSPSGDPSLRVRPAASSAWAPRLGLCCAFARAPIRFRRTTARRAGVLSAAARRQLLRRLAADNAAALAEAVEWCAAHGIGAFRVNSEILPLCTHPQLGYTLDRIDRHGELRAAFGAAANLARRDDVRLSLHPDQFVVPGSARAEVVASSLAELEAQAAIADLVGAEQLTIHGGGAEGGKAAALGRLALGLAQLSARARSRIVLENDDRIYTVADLLPLCAREGLPLAYDVHHHRCNPDGLSVEEATLEASRTWGGREPWVHISSPRGGWRGEDPRRHADHISPRDLPACWIGRRMTIDVEAKAKELAVLRLQAHIRRRRRVQSEHPGSHSPGEHPAAGRHRPS